MTHKLLILSKHITNLAMLNNKFTRLHINGANTLHSDSLIIARSIYEIHNEATRCGTDRPSNTRVMTIEAIRLALPCHLFEAACIVTLLENEAAFAEEYGPTWDLSLRLVMDKSE
jgi:hypothetical protein